MKANKITKIVALMMTIVMLTLFTPIAILEVMAEGIKEIDFSQKIEIDDEVKSININNYNDEAFIEKEFVEKRTVSSKQFLLDDGMIMVQDYGVPIHFQDKDGFKEIDNSLLLKTSDAGEKYYENAANNFKVKFHDSLSESKKISMENYGYTLEFAPNNFQDKQLQPSKAEIITSAENNIYSKKNLTIPNTDAVDYSKVKLKQPVQPNVGETALIYKNVFENIDFEYKVTSLGVKEDIVVHQPLKDYKFSYTISAPGLKLVLNEFGEIIAFSENYEAIFEIPAPNMTDANGIYSEDVYYTLTDKKDGAYILEIIASDIWMSMPDRDFPVKIDPAVYSVTRGNANGLTLYYSSGGREYNQSRVKFGKVNSDTCEAFISFPEASDQFYLSGYQLAYSKLRYYIRSVGANAAGTTEYQLRTAKSLVPLSAVSSFSQLEYNSGVLFKGSIKSTKFLFFNASHEERWEEAWFNPEAFNGCPDMVFMWYYTSVNDNQHGEVDIRSGNLPSVLNYYVSTVGVNEDLPYETFEYNGGTANVNLINGALTASFNALSIDVPTNPISLELIYNDYYNEIMTEFGMHQMFGNNIKINFQQAKKHETRAVRYIDEDGSIDTLSQDIGPGNSVFYSINKNITFNSSVNGLFIGGTTKLLFDGNKSYRYYDASFIHKEKLMYEIFYSGSKITQIAGYTENVKTHYISFTYSGDRVSYAQSYIATDITGYTFQLLARCDFSYDSSGNLTQIKNHNSNNRKFAFEYYDGQLWGIIDFDGNGYRLGRTHWTDSSPVRMSIVNTIYGNSAAYNNYYSYEYVTFSSDTKATRVSYYNSDGKFLGARNISRRFSKGVQSEWYEDDKGEIAVSTASSTLTGPTSQEYLTYTQNLYSTEQKQNTTLSGSFYSVSPGGSLSGSILSSHGIVSKTGRQYCISLSIETSGSTFVEILVNGTKRGSISLNGATNSYFIIPVIYYSGSVSIQIKNTGNNYIYISKVSYNYYTSAKVTKRIETMSIFNYINSVQNTGLDYRQTTNYNFNGQITNISETDYSGSSPVTKSYTFTYENYPNVSPSSDYDVKRLKSIKTGTREATYTYTSNSSTHSKVEIASKDGSTNLYRTISETNGALGNYYTLQTENGITTRIDYGIKYGNVRPYKITAGNIITEYEYNYDGQITAVKENGTITQSINYNGGKETDSSIGGTLSYTLVRDSAKFGLITGINANGNRMLTVGYNGYGDMSSLTYANGATAEYVYDYRQLQSVQLKDSSASPITYINYGYDSNSNLDSITQSKNDITELSYLLSSTDFQRSMSVSGDLTAEYTYNYNPNNGRLENRNINLGNGAATRTEIFTYGSYGLLQNHGNASYSTAYTYDSMHKADTKKQLVSGVERQSLKYYYNTSGGYPTNQISSIVNQTNNKTQNYGYNSSGYISSYSTNFNGDSYSYSYDAAGRLKNDGKYSYNYDAFNNIKTKVNLANSATTTWNYDSTKKMQLNNVIENGTTKYFSYDSLGNMISYKGADISSPQNLYWTRGNMLSSGSGIVGNKNFSYKYGPDGLRYSKTVDGIETVYYWNGDLLMGEKTGTNYTQYLYDASGIIGMVYNGAYYYFEKNIFGDVLKAYNSGGTEVASFTYDSWGNLLSQNGSMASKINIRYRGYYYDSETNFYYLQTRYYDSSINRFISADQYELIPMLSKSLGELNVYSYCANNPVMFIDPSGTSLTWIIVGIVISTAIIGGVAAYNHATSLGITGVGLYVLVGLGAVAGAAAGLLIVTLAMELPLISIGGGTWGLVGGGTAGGAAIVIPATEIVLAGTLAASAVTAGELLSNVMFSKGHGPRMGHNQKENKEFKDAMRELGIKRTDYRWQEAHRALQNEPPMRYKELLEFIKSLFGV